MTINIQRWRTAWQKSHRWKNCIYNLDRAAASLLLGAPPQETISSQVGRKENSNRLAKWIAARLDKIQANHVEKAIKHADELNKADDGAEQ